MFRKKEKEQPTGLVRAHVEIKRLDRQRRKVKALIISVDTEDTVYKATYKTTVKTNFGAYNNAVDQIKQHLGQEDYVLYEKITTNIQLPTIITTYKRSR